MWRALGKLVGGGKSAGKTPPPTGVGGNVPGLSRGGNGRLGPGGPIQHVTNHGTQTEDEGKMAGNGNGNAPGAAGKPNSPGGPSHPAAPGGANGAGPPSAPGSLGAAGQAPSTSALNKQVVQSASFSNYENADYAQTMAVTPPELMVGQTTGLAVQDAANYMNAIMQIAVAAQAVAIKQAAENPALAEKEIPLLADIQQMVTQAVTVYGTVSSTAGTSAKTVFSDLKAG